MIKSLLNFLYKKILVQRNYSETMQEVPLPHDFVSIETLMLDNRIIYKIKFKGIADNSHKYFHIYNSMNIEIEKCLYNEVEGVILDLTELSYEWGDNMSHILNIEFDGKSIPLAAVISDVNREGLTSLVRDELFSHPANLLAENINEAHQILRNQFLLEIFSNKYKVELPQGYSCINLNGIEFELNGVQWTSFLPAELDSETKRILDAFPSKKHCIPIAFDGFGNTIIAAPAIGKGPYGYDYFEIDSNMYNCTKMNTELNLYDLYNNTF